MSVDGTKLYSSMFLLKHIISKYFYVSILLSSSYNPLERRDACKGGKEANKRTAPTHASKSSSTAPKAQASHSTRKNDAHSANASQKTTKLATNAGGQAYDEQVN